MSVHPCDPAEALRILLEDALRAKRVVGTVQKIQDGDLSVFEVRVDAKDFSTMTNLDAPAWLAMHTLVQSMALIHKHRFSLVFVDPPGVQWSQGVEINLRPSSISNMTHPKQSGVGTRL